MRIPGAVLLPENEEAAGGTHVVTSRNTKSKETVNIGAARSPASHGPEYNGPQSTQRSSCSSGGQSRLTPEICST